LKTSIASRISTTTGVCATIEAGRRLNAELPVFGSYPSIDSSEKEAEK